VIDEHRESTYDGGAGGAAEYGYTVWDLDCGHELHGDPVRVGPAPGAPYADHRTAASTKAGDLAASRREERP
jgi:hypothetical protein